MSFHSYEIWRRSEENNWKLLKTEHSYEFPVIYLKNNLIFCFKNRFVNPASHVSGKLRKELNAFLPGWTNRTNQFPFCSHGNWEHGIRPQTLSDILTFILGYIVLHNSTGIVHSFPLFSDDTIKTLLLSIFIPTELNITELHNVIFIEILY